MLEVVELSPVDSPESVVKLLVPGLSESPSVVSDEAELLVGSGSGVQAGAVFLSVPAL